MLIYKDLYGRFYTTDAATLSFFKTLNKEYEKQLRLQQNGVNIYPQKYINLYHYDRQTRRYYLPPSLLNKQQVFLKIDANKASTFSLRPRQEKVIKDINNYNSLLIRAPTGAGKSWLIGFLLYTIDTNAVVVVPTKEVMFGIENFFKMFGQDKHDLLQIIEGAKQKIKGKYLLMHYQTFNNIYEKLSGKYELLIIDEAHSLPKERIKQITMWKRLKKIIGFTATPRRKELDVKDMEKFFGKMIRINDDEVGILKPIVYMKKIQIDITLDELQKIYEKHKLKSTTQSHQAYRYAVYEYGKIYEKLYYDIIDFQNRGYTKFIILIDSKYYLKKIVTQLKDKLSYNIYEFSGDIKKKDRQKIIEDIKGGKIDKFIIIAQRSIGSVGLDIPNLEVGILVYPTERDQNVEQAIGRIRRTAEGKKKPIWIDYCYKLKVQYSRPIYMHCKKRQEKYKQMGLDLYIK